MFFNNQRNLFGVFVKEASHKGYTTTRIVFEAFPCDQEILVEDLWQINLDTVEKCHPTFPSEMTTPKKN